jgi:transcriptional regulator with XRE-family HTH domain
MPLPTFDRANAMASSEVLDLLRDRVRLERKKLGYTQAEFAQQCGIALRTFKRFELGGAGSIDLLIGVVQVFGRGPGFDLLFPAQLATLKPRGIDAALMSIRAKLDDGVVKGEARANTAPT